jgi:hypothetical protein
MKASRMSILAVLLGAALAVSACGEEQGLSFKDVKPNKGPYLGGEVVTITGSGFNPTQGLTVYFITKDANGADVTKKAKNPTIESATQIRVDPPGGDPGQVADILIIFNDNTRLTIPKAYTYIDPVGQPK